MRELFIYYRIRWADAPGAKQAVCEFQHRLCERHPGLRARLLRSPDERDGLQTWMETYASEPMHSPLGITPEIQAEIEVAASDLLPLIVGRRHLEVFVA